MAGGARASAGSASSERAAAAAYLGPRAAKDRGSASSYAAASRSYSVQAERAKKLARGRVSASTVRERLAEAPDQFPGSSVLGDVGEILDPADVLLGSEIAQRFRPCFEAMLPSAICPAELREAVWRLTHWALARSDAGRLEADSLVELLVARKTPLPDALVRDADGSCASSLASEFEFKEPAAETAELKGLGKRGGLGGWLLSPAAVGVMAHVAFDAAAEHAEIRDFYHALHALLSGAITLGAAQLLRALRRDETSSCLLRQWGLPCPAPYSPMNLGGVVGLLRLRGAALMAVLAKLPRSARMPVPTALGMRRWARMTMAARRKGEEGEGRPPHELVPRPFFIFVRRWLSGATENRDVDREEEAPAAPFASWGVTPGGELAGLLHTEILQIVSSSPQRWGAMRLVSGIGDGVVHGYTMEPALRECVHCRVDVMQCTIAKVASTNGYAHGAQSRGAHHQSVDAVAVCRLAPEVPGGPWREYHFVFPHLIAMGWAIQAAKVVRSVDLVPVLCARTPANHFLLDPSPRGRSRRSAKPDDSIPADIHVARQPSWAAAKETFSRLCVEGSGQPPCVVEILTPLVTVVAPALSPEEVQKMIALRESFAQQHGVTKMLGDSALDEAGHRHDRRTNFDTEGQIGRRRKSFHAKKTQAGQHRTAEMDSNGVRSRHKVEVDKSLDSRRNARVAEFAESLDSLGADVAVLECVEAGQASKEALAMKEAMKSMAVVHILVTQPQPIFRSVTGEVHVETKSGTANAGDHFVACHRRVPFSLSSTKPQVTLTVEVEVLHSKKRRPGDDEVFYVELARTVCSTDGQVDPSKKSSTVVVLDPSKPAVQSKDPAALVRIRNKRVSAIDGSGHKHGCRQDTLKATTQLVDVWQPVTAMQSCCLRCGMTGTRHTTGVMWPQCLALHGPPATFAILPRVDILMLSLADQRRHQASALIRIDGLPGCDVSSSISGASKTKTEHPYSGHPNGTRGMQSDTSGSSSDEELDQPHEWPLGLNQWASDEEADDDLDGVEIDPQVSVAFGNAFTTALIKQKTQAELHEQMSSEANENSGRSLRPASAAELRPDGVDPVSSALSMIANVSFLPEEHKKTARVRPMAKRRPQSAAAAYVGANHPTPQRGANSRSAPSRRRAPPGSAPRRVVEWNDDVLLPGRSARSASVNRAKYDRRSLLHMALDEKLVQSAIESSSELQSMLQAAPGLRKLLKNPTALAAVMQAKANAHGDRNIKHPASSVHAGAGLGSVSSTPVSIADLPAAIQVGHSSATKSRLAQKAAIGITTQHDYDSTRRPGLSRRQKSIRNGCNGMGRQSRKLSEAAAVKAASGEAGTGPRGLVKLAEAVDCSGQVNAYGADGRTPLVAAAANGNLEGVLLLLSRGANPLKPAKIGGETPLIAAAERGHADVVATLVEAIETADDAGEGATEAAINKANLREGRGRTAMVAALEGGHAAVVELLAAAGGEVPAEMSGRALIMAEKHGLHALLATTATQQAQQRKTTTNHGHSNSGETRGVEDGAEIVGGGAEDADADAWLDQLVGSHGGDEGESGSTRVVMSTVSRSDINATKSSEDAVAAKTTARAEAVRAMAFAGLEAGQEQEDMRFLEELERWQKEFWSNPDS